MSSSTAPSTLTSLSNDLAGAVEAAARFTVAIDAHSRYDASGILWRPGVVVSAAHAIAEDGTIALILPSGTSVTGTLIGYDPSTDLAAIGFSASEPGDGAPIADAGALRVGTLVMAVARDAERGISASLGVISALGEAWRTWRGGQIDRFIRPDVSLYPGSSGGPLVDGRGRVIGMNTGGLSRRLGITVPAATIERVVSALQSGGRIARGYLGVGMQPIRLPAALQQSLELAGGGVIVIAVEPGSPADRSGVIIGDVFLEIDGARIEDIEDLQALLGSDRVGTTVNARILRGGADRRLEIAIGERPAHQEN